MKTITERFGTFVGIDANGAVYANGNSAWLSSLEEMNALAQRDAFVGIRELTNGVDTSCTGLTRVGDLYAHPRLRAMLDEAGFGFVNNCEGAVVNPVKGTTGLDSVIGVGTIGAGDDALVWHETDKPNNARWKYSVMANAFPNKFPLSIFLVGNEPDGNGNRISAYAPTGVGDTIGAFSLVHRLDRTELLRRLALLQRQAYEELRGPNRKWTKHKHPSVVASYANTGAGMQNLNPPPGTTYSVYHFFNYNNGEFLTTCDVIAIHYHDFASVFETTGVPNAGQSPWHLWTAIQQGQALAGTGAIHPIYCNEGNCGTESNLSSTYPIDAPQRTSFNYPETADNLLARRLLKVRRTGMTLCTLFYWSFPAWFLYNHNASNSVGSVWCPAGSFTPREPSWTAVKHIFNPDNYVLTGRAPWSLAITAKPWSDLTNTTTQATVGDHDPATWAILGDLHQGEKAAADSPTDRTWYEWDRATITDNQIAFTAPVAGQGNQMNRAMRPVILPGHGRYRVNCTVAGNAGTARLIARGWNALDGLATTAGQSGSETTAVSAALTATFTTVPHDVKHFPNLPKVAVVLECTASANYSDVTIEPA